MPTIEKFGFFGLNSCGPRIPIRTYFRGADGSYGAERTENWRNTYIMKHGSYAVRCSCQTILIDAIFNQKGRQQKTQCA
jgi:hypothetical protein